MTRKGDREMAVSKGTYYNLTSVLGGTQRVKVTKAQARVSGGHRFVWYRTVTSSGELSSRTKSLLERVFIKQAERAPITITELEG